MSFSVYRKLQEQLDQWSVGYPVSPTGLEIKLLEKIFTVEEAELFLSLGLNLETPETVAGRAGRQVDRTSALLEQMAGKGLVFRHIKGENVRYSAPPFVLGIYEFQLKKMDREFARLFEEYFEETFSQTLAGATPLLRPIPINRSVKTEASIATHEDALAILKQQKKIVIADCICRVQQELVDHNCEKPKEVCFIFGSGGQYYLDHHMGREISLDEAMEILEKCHQAGLVVQPSSPQNSAGMCNCCGDCCAALRALAKHPNPGKMVMSNYVAEVDQSQCTACEVCLDRCQMAAIKLTETAAIDPDRCIGCGLCVTTCPAEAIELKRKPEDQVVTPPATNLELLFELAKTRQKELVPLSLTK